MSTPEPTEEELRTALEEQLRHVTVDDVVIQTAVTLVNLAGRRLGLGPEASGERDLEQVRDAIDAVRGLLPVLDRRGGETIRPLRDAVAQLQMEYAKLAGPAASPEPGGAAGSAAGGEGAPGVGGEDVEEGGPGPAQASGRLWVPGT